MQYEIQCKPTFSVVECKMQAGEQIVAESGAMAWMEGPIDMQTSTRGGVLQGLKRAMLAGESFFQNTFTAQGESEITFAPPTPGDIVAHELSGDELHMQKGAYLASMGDVRCDSKWDGFRGMFNEGLFLLRVSGSGLMFFSSYGRIETLDIDGTYTIDNGYAVAWEPTLQYRLTKARRIRSFLFSDQILLQFSGKGRLWVQSRSPVTLADWVYPYRRVESKD